MMTHKGHEIKEMIRQQKSSELVGGGQIIHINTIVNV